MHKSRSNFMHFARWVAALLVVLSHLRSVLFVDFKDLPTSHVLTKAFYLITSLGHESVIVFFVLSGYLICNSIINQLKVDEFVFSKYLINRFTRIYAVLVIALLLTLVLDFLGSRWDTVGLYTNRLHIPTINFDASSRLSVGHFLCSLLMLQNIILPTFGSNGPLWSLNYEFWYYLLFPALFVPLFAIYNNKFSKSHYLYLGLTILIIFILPSSIIKYFVVWMLGIIPIYATFRNENLKYLLGGVFCFFIVLKGNTLHLSSEFLQDFITGILFTLLLSTFQNTTDEIKSINLNEILASFSYTIYLIHLPLLLFMSSSLKYFSEYGVKMTPSIFAYFIFSLFLITIYLFSYLIAYFTEFKTKTIKDFIENKIQPKLVNKFIYSTRNK